MLWYLNKWKCFWVRLLHLHCFFLKINILFGISFCFISDKSEQRKRNQLSGLLGTDINIFKTGKCILNKGMNTPRFRGLVKC